MPRYIFIWSTDFVLHFSCRRWKHGPYINIGSVLKVNTMYQIHVLGYASFMDGFKKSHKFRLSLIYKEQGYIPYPLLPTYKGSN